MLQGIHDDIVSHIYSMTLMVMTPPQHNTHSYWLPIYSTSHIDISSCFRRVICIGGLIEF